MTHVAYLTSCYPGPSHTFIRREIAGVRGRGVEVSTFSARRPAREGQLTEVDRRESERTFYLVPTSAREAAVMVAAHLGELGAHPLRYFRTLKLAVSHRVPGMTALVWAFFYFAEAILLASELRRREITHLHNHFANPAAIVGMLASFHYGLNWSLTLHGISEFDYPAGLLLKEKLRRADFAACASYFTMAQAMRNCDPRDWNKLFICHCGIEVNALPEGRDQNRSIAGCRIICVGRLSPEKGHLGLLQAVAELRNRGVDFSLSLVGDGPERQSVLDRIGELGLANRVTLLGQLDERTTLQTIRQHDVLVSASLMEGLPVVLMEAMALGVAVLAPRIAGVPELIRHDENGLLFCPADWDDLADQLRRLVGDATLRQRLTEVGRETVLEAFLVEQSAALMSRYFAGR
ncbi:MAG: glycosyltransferase family 4 protein [Myxococcales bacterium]|nr:glycosyltransferase family 4 protein [Myxococcales bacterium]MDH3485663.1 glycosyltransferase family 4 protein [Myxococcales bacterium]